MKGTLRLASLLAGPLLLLAAAPAAGETGLPLASPVPGGVVLLPFVYEGEGAPEVYYEDRRVTVVRTDAGWTAVVGIPLGAALGAHAVEARGGARIVFDVQDKAYEVQHITLSNRRMVTPPADELARIAEETARINEAFARWTDAASLPLPFQRPVAGRESSAFGLRRVFNGEERSPHSGIDIAAPLGTLVRAPAPGTVVNTGDYYFNGRTVFLDHGQGLITMYCHLDEIRVREGQQLARGEVLGTVGMSGRATGPHLHWTVSLNNARVDPRLFLAAD